MDTHGVGTQRNFRPIGGLHLSPKNNVQTLLGGLIGVRNE